MIARARKALIGTMASRHFFSLEVQRNGNLQFSIWLLGRQDKIEPIADTLVEQLVESQ